MKKSLRRIMTLLFLCLITTIVFANIPIVILPFSGDDPLKTEIEGIVKEQLQKSRNISLVADNLMKRIAEIHEKAQALDSQYHDISKLKVAEYLISGKMSNGNLSIKVIDVNKGTEVFNKYIAINNSDKHSQIRSLCTNIHKSIELNVGTSGPKDIPENACDFMEVLQKFTNSLKSKNENSYPYMAFYYKGKYTQVTKNNKALASKANIFLKVIRSNLVRAKISFLSLEENPPWTNVFIVSNKRGKRMRHKFGMLELDSGNLVIGLHEILR